MGHFSWERKAAIDGTGKIPEGKTQTMRSNSNRVTQSSKELQHVPNHISELMSGVSCEAPFPPLHRHRAGSGRDTDKVSVWFPHRRLEEFAEEHA